MKTALITGIGGQDGPYLARLLLSKGYAVYGLNKNRGSLENLDKLGIRQNVSIWEGDITDPSCVNLVLKAYRPDEIYNLAAQSHVGHSFVAPQLTCSVNYMGYLNVLLGARAIVPNARIYQAGTSEMFGYAASILQNEETPLQPKSPYAVAKVAAHWSGVNARYESDQFVANGILFNHESPLRHPGFVTKKITNKVKRIIEGDGEPLRLGNIDSKRDWGYAPDYVEAMWLMLQHERPDDFVIATGKAHTVREFVSETFKQYGKTIEYFGTGQSETGWVDGKRVMEIDPQFYRPNELGYLCGDSTKAREVLGWQPKVSFEQLVEIMVMG